jgi:hypothetical protein
MDSWCTEESSSKKKRKVASDATLELIRDRAEQDAKLDKIVFDSLHRREIMMAQRIIDENTLCLSGVEPCDYCRKELDLG